MRGKADVVQQAVSCIGITPAYAGKSQNGRCNDFDKRDHPRLCGEKFAAASARLLYLGSPPPMRGKDWRLPKYQRIARITPAYAGKSKKFWIVVVLIEDHPRLCGEKLTR